MLLRALLFVMFAMATVSLAADEIPAYPPTRFPDTSQWGRNIQRTMRRLATSTPTERHTVRVLFYGQSITEQKWSALVEADLRQRFPHANLIVENRALAGFSSQLLVKTAETDLYPFQPDLVIFHVYGAHNSYEDIIRRIRERTTAEILMQTDHVVKPEDLTEETDPEKVPIQSGNWDAFMNHNWFPSLARKYGAELCDQRSLWKGYLTQHGLAPQALLSDSVHLNAHGEWLMAECVKAYLRYDPAFGPAPAEEWVQTYRVGTDLQWSNQQLQLDFDGNRVDVVFDESAERPASSGLIAVQIDGRAPSEIPELYGFTRAVTTPAGKWPVKWPVVAPITSHHERPVLEEWTLTTMRDAENEALFHFALQGSVTGADGTGRSDHAFVSDSGRVVIAAEDWNAQYALALAGINPIPESFEVRWRVEPHFVDTFDVAALESLATPAGASGPALTLAHGLRNGRHTLTLSCGAGAALQPITALRVYRPALVPQ